ncbi:hypothetical protein ACQKDB_11780 [Planococcus kocurii]|uniref:Uncharacterized protein n=1 Tax=Planococcus kocurii TaxID=1374 RepID=A0ABM5WUG0_9BACL|nr:hypothetical protein [Planococcus kocurii]ALS77959.1 hypothetical protein AUO94_04550 [Planococcus kocurii]
MRTLFLKMFIPILFIGLFLTMNVDSHYMAAEAPAMDEQQTLNELEAEVTEKLVPYEKQLADVEEALNRLLAALERQEMISFEQYQQYQSTLDELIRRLNTISQEIAAESTLLSNKFEDLLRVQKKIDEMDVK